MLSNNLSTPRSNASSLNTSKSVELPFMLSILRTLKEHFNAVNKEHYNSRAPIEDLFNLFQQLLNNYIQLYLPVKSKQNYIKASTSITNTLRDEIALFLDNNYSSSNSTPQHNNKANHSSHGNSSSTFLNISSESSFTLNNGCLNGVDKDKFNDSFLNCRELSNEDIIKKIKQKIEKKNIDMTIQYHTIPTCPNNATIYNNSNQLIYNTQSIFTPVKNIKPRYYHTKHQPLNSNSANIHNQKAKNNNKTTKSINISINTTETPVAKHNHNSSYIKERTLSMPNKKAKPISKLIHPNNKTHINTSGNNRNTTLGKSSTKEPAVNTSPNVSSNTHTNANTNVNVSMDKNKTLNNSFNHPVHSHRQYSVPSQSNQHDKHLRAHSNTSTSVNKNPKEKKEEPLLTTTTLISQPNPNKQTSQSDKMNLSINDNSKLNATFVCTTVKTGNVVQKYTLNTKANQNIPKASRYANCLLSKYKGLIAAYNDGQVPGKK